MWPGQAASAAGSPGNTCVERARAHQAWWSARSSNRTQVNAEDRPAPGRVAYLHAAAMLVHHLPHEVQAEAASRGARAKAVKGLEHALTLGGRYSRAVILDLEGRSKDADDDIGPAVVDRVLNEVHEYALQRCRIADAGSAAHDLKRDGPSSGDDERCQVSANPPDNCREVERRVVAGVLEAVKVEKLFGHGREPLHVQRQGADGLSAASTLLARTAMGVRSSCEAEAMNRFWRSYPSSSRLRASFTARTSGAISCGT